MQSNTQTPPAFTYWKNNKTGNKYQVIGCAVNRTNANEGERMVRYVPVPWGGSDDEYHVRNISEFLEKFTECKR